MSFTLRDIPGAVVEKLQSTEDSSHKALFNIRGFNDGIDAQASVKLRLNREKLAALTYEQWVRYCDDNGTYGMTGWDKLSDFRKEYHYNLADAIMAEVKNIVEVERP